MANQTAALDADRAAVTRPPLVANERKLDWITNNISSIVEAGASPRFTSPAATWAAGPP